MSGGSTPVGGSPLGSQRGSFNRRLEPSEQLSQPSSPLLQQACLRLSSPLSRTWDSPIKRASSPLRGTQAVVDDVLARRTVPHQPLECPPRCPSPLAEQVPDLAALDELTADELRATLRAIANLSKGHAHLTAEAARATIEQRGPAQTALKIDKPGIGAHAQQMQW